MKLWRLTFPGILALVCGCSGLPQLTDSVPLPDFSGSSCEPPPEQKALIYSLDEDADGEYQKSHAVFRDFDGTLTSRAGPDDKTKSTLPGKGGVAANGNGKPGSGATEGSAAGVAPVPSAELQSAGPPTSTSVAPVVLTPPTKSAAISFEYATPVINALASQPIPARLPQVQGGTVARFVAVPELPPGISLEPTSGAILGTPQLTMRGEQYTIQGLDAAGNVLHSTVITIIVSEP